MGFWILPLLVSSLLLLGAGCSEQSPCDENYILFEGECCADYDANGICDIAQVIDQPKVEEQEKPKIQEEPIEPVREPTGYFWDDALISIESYACGNNTVSIELKNNVGATISIDKVRLGNYRGRGLPETVGIGKTTDVVIYNEDLVEGKPIDMELFIEYRDWTLGKTRYLGPSKVEGDCR